MRTIKLAALLLVLLIVAACDSGTYHEVKVLNGGDVVDELLVRDGKTYTLPQNPDKDMILLGWMMNDDKENLKQPGDEVKITGETVIKAVWDVPKAAFASIKSVWSSIETVTITAGNDVTVMYTTDGSDPVYDNDPALRNGEIGRNISLSGLSGSVTIKAITVKGNGVSDVMKLDITVVDPPAEPVLEGVSDVMNQGEVIRVQVIENTTVRYTFDGTEPAEDNGSEGEEISLSGIAGGIVLKVVRFDENGIASKAVVKTVTVRPLKPAADVSDGEEKGQKDKVSLSAEKGCYIRYTLDGTEPSEENENAGIYDGIYEKIKLQGKGGNVRLRAVAVTSAGDTASEELVVDFYVIPAAVGFSAREDEVLEQGRIVTASANGSDEIYYTLDGSDPKTSGTRQCGSRIPVAGCSGNTVIKAYAAADGIESDTVERRVRVKPETPDISGVAVRGRYLKTDRITGMTGPEGTVLRYTVDGYIPDSESREVPADGIPLSDAASGEVVIKIAAEKDGVVSQPAELTVNVYDYRLTYDLDGGVDTYNTAGEVWYNRGESVTLAGGISKDGWYLDGWYTERNGQGTFYDCYSVRLMNLSSDLTLYAHWVDKKIFFNNCNTYYTVSAKSISFTQGDILIPANYLGKPVVLKEGAFKGCTGITSLEFEEKSAITEIPAEAFMGTKIQKVTNMPEVTAIGNSAFENCETVSAFFREENGYTVIPSGVTLGEYVFRGATAAALEIRAGLTELPAGTFQNAKIKKIRLPETVKAINGYAFAASGVEDVNLENIEDIMADAFNDADSLKTVELANVKTVGEKAFYSCSSLEKAAIGSSIEEIAGTAFKHCTKAAITVDRLETDNFTGRENAPWGAEGMSTLSWKTE